VVGECRPEGPAHEPRFHALKPTPSFKTVSCVLYSYIQDRGTQQRERGSAPGVRRVRVCAAPFNLHPVRMMFVNVNTTDATTGVCVKL
jgi:hypothetical protein